MTVMKVAFFQEKVQRQRARITSSHQEIDFPPKYKTFCKLEQNISFFKLNSRIIYATAKLVTLTLNTHFREKFIVNATHRVAQSKVKCLSSLRFSSQECSASLFFPQAITVRNVARQCWSQCRDAWRSNLDHEYRGSVQYFREPTLRCCIETPCVLAGQLQVLVY